MNALCPDYFEDREPEAGPRACAKCGAETDGWLCVACDEGRSE